MRELHIDFETYSEAELKKVGPWAYSCHPSTEVLMMAWAWDDDAPQIWLPGEDFPEWYSWPDMASLWGGADLGYQITAHNDFFEYCILHNVLEWPLPPVDNWYDVAADAAALALPRSLEEGGEVVGVDVASLKDKEGKALINWFCKPYKVKGKSSRRMPADHPEKFEKFKEYCKQDVVAHRALKRRLRTLQPCEREVWELDRTINLRGVRFDVENVKNAIAIREQAKERILEEVNFNTMGDLKNINSTKQLKEYLERVHDIKVENTQAEYLKAFASELPEESQPRWIIEKRLEIAKSSLAKYDKLLDILDGDRAYGLLRYHGATTGRWSGNLFQPQNLPRPSFDDADVCVELFHHRDAALIDEFFGPPLEALSSSLRSMVIASPGCRLIVSDFSQIESRVLAWLAGEEKKLLAYKDKLDIYKVNASGAYGTKYEDITKYQRSIGKVIELACGYQGGIGAFKRFAENLGVDIEEGLAKSLIKKWRAANPKIKSYWYDVERAALDALKHPGEVFTVRNVKYRVVGRPHVFNWKGEKYNCVGSFLYCKLPSGRVISYHNPHFKTNNFDKQAVAFFGVDSDTRKYVEQDTYGGKLVENITQAVARDCMLPAMFALEKKGYRIVLTVHDEIITDTPNGVGSIEEMNKIMSTTPTWAKGLPIDAAGYESKRYRKD
jgi:DNA polymerase